MYEIIKNTPAPTPRERYPFPRMVVGDAFDVPVGWDARKTQGRIAAAAASWKGRNNPAAKFSVRRLDERTLRCRRDA